MTKSTNTTKTTKTTRANNEQINAKIKEIAGRAKTIESVEEGVAWTKENMRASLEDLAKPGVLEQRVEEALKKHRESSNPFTELFAAAGVDEAPSWKRQVAAFVASCTVGYVVGTVGGAIMDILYIGVFLYTTSQFLAVVIALLAALITIYVAVSLGQTVGGYIVSGDIDADLKRAKDNVCAFASRVFNKFKRA